MNKKGFTMIELLGTIVILGLLMIVAYPMVTRYYVESKNKTYDTYVKTLYEASRMYLQKHSADKPTYGYPTKVYATTLKEEGFIDDLKDATKRSEDCIYSESYVVIVNNTKNKKGEKVRSNDDFSYEVVLKCPSKKVEKEYK